MVIHAVEDLVGHLECLPAEAALHFVRVDRVLTSQERVAGGLAVSPHVLARVQLVEGHEHGRILRGRLHEFLRGRALQLVTLLLIRD